MGVVGAVRANSTELSGNNAYRDGFPKILLCAVVLHAYTLVDEGEGHIEGKILD